MSESSTAIFTHDSPKEWTNTGVAAMLKIHSALEFCLHIFVQRRWDDTAPCDYMKAMLEQVAGGDLVYGGITDADDLNRNLAENCIPEGFEKMDIWDYAMFLEQRRTLMAQYIRDYYKQLD